MLAFHGRVHLEGERQSAAAQEEGEEDPFLTCTVTTAALSYYAHTSRIRFPALSCCSIFDKVERGNRWTNSWLAVSNGLCPESLSQHCLCVTRAFGEDQGEPGMWTWGILRVLLLFLLLLVGVSFGFSLVVYT